MAGVQTSVYRLLGTMCLAYGIFILLLMAIPNPLSGRMAFFFVGGTFCVVGALLKRAGAIPAPVIEAQQVENSSHE